jgi:hypothetical protein
MMLGRPDSQKIDIDDELCAMILAAHHDMMSRENSSRKANCPSDLGPENGFIVHYLKHGASL